MWEETISGERIITAMELAAKFLWSRDQDIAQRLVTNGNAQLLGAGQQCILIIEVQLTECQA